MSATPLSISNYIVNDIRKMSRSILDSVVTDVPIGQAVMLKGWL